MLKAYIQSLEDVPEALREHYKASEAEGGGFYLQTEGVEDVSGLKSALDNERKLNKDAKKFYTDHKDFDFDLPAQLEADYQKKLEEAAGNADKVAEIKAAHEREKAAMAEKHQAERDGWTKEKEGFNKEFSDMMITKALALELQGIAKNDHAAKILLKMAEDEFEVVNEDGVRSVRVKDGKGGYQITAGGSYKDIAARVAEMANEDRFADLVKGSGASGSGAPAKNNSGGSGGGSTNPWAKDSWNLTKQGEIYKESPERAKRLQAEAGR